VWLWALPRPQKTRGGQTLRTLRPGLTRSDVVATLVVGTALALAPATATAATPGLGGLIRGGCIQDTGGADCSGVGGNAAGLNGAIGVATSGDGKNVYVASRFSDAIAAFKRDGTTGGLNPGGCIGAPCAGGNADGLDGAGGVAVGADGKNVFVASDVSDALGFFGRDATTGGLAAGDCVEDENSDANCFRGDGKGLDGAIGVATSGDDVYVASSESDAITVYRRSTNGEATGGSGFIPGGCVQNTGSGTTCGGNLPGLDGASAVAVSGDGKHVYVASLVSDAIATFGRDTTTGGLTPGGCIQNTGRTACSGLGGNMPGLDGASGVAVSGDGRNVYVASRFSGAIATFGRDAATGGLTPGGCIQNTGGTACDGLGGNMPGLDGASGVAVSGDGRNVYVASRYSDAIAVFRRNTASGGLTPGGCIQNTGGTACDGLGGNAPGLDGASGVAVSGDGKNVYVASLLSDAIVVFGRDAVTPELTKLSVQPATWAVGPKRGTTFGYTLSEPAQVVFTIERKLPGRRVSGKCVRPRPANRGRPSCTRFSLFGRFEQQGVAGQNTKRFAGRIGTNSLAPGNYRATLVASDAVGLRSAPRRVGFTVVSR
jgi:6-phosphogluconolactonase (cycloisomerase 2 family)